MRTRRRETSISCWGGVKRRVLKLLGVRRMALMVPAVALKADAENAAAGEACATDDDAIDGVLPDEWAGNAQSASVIDILAVPPYEPQRGRGSRPIAQECSATRPLPRGMAHSTHLSVESDEDEAGAVDSGVNASDVGASSWDVACGDARVFGDAEDEQDAALLTAKDADAATDLGTAFHRLAQLAVLAWRPGCALERPGAARQHAFERSCGLTAAQRARLMRRLSGGSPAMWLHALQRAKTRAQKCRSSAGGKRRGPGIP